MFPLLGLECSTMTHTLLYEGTTKPHPRTQEEWQSVRNVEVTSMGHDCAGPC